MWQKILAIFLAWLLTFEFVSNAWANYQIDSSYPIPSMTTMDGKVIPDLNQITFSDIPPIASSGGFNLRDVNTGYDPNQLISFLGYDPSRSWTKGTQIEDILKLGDFQGISDIMEWNLTDIATEVGIILEGLKLNDFGLLENQTVENLLFAIPSLAGIDIKSVKPIYDLAKTVIGLKDLLDKQTIGDIASSNLELAKAQLNAIDLSQYDLNSIPGLENVQFGEFAKASDASMSSIPYLEYVKLASLVFDLLSPNLFAKIDVVYGEKEAQRVNTVSGSYQEGFNVPCYLPSCAYIELTDAEDIGLVQLHGKQWISGKSQQVEGGMGPLKWINGTGKEPTGRNVFGEFFKVVLTDTNESLGKADFGLYFRICLSIFGVKSCSPYFIGPFPWFSHKEKDIILLGIGSPAAKGNTPSHPEGGTINPDGSYLPPEEEATPQEEDCTSYKGVNLGALTKAIANIESRGSGDYLAVGNWVKADGGKNYGRALGKYQYMSYREEVVAAFSRKEGGLELLKQIEQNTIGDAEIKRLLPNYFPEEIQEQTRQQDFRNLLDSAYNLGDRGSKLVYRLGGWHYAGVNGFHNGYAQRAEAEYVKELSKTQLLCQQPSFQKCKGRLIKPAAFGIRTSGFGWRIHPITKKQKNHNGVDIAANPGTPILAADSGEVISVQKGCQVGEHRCGGGFGNYIKIRHCNGWIAYYAHLSSVGVKLNQKVIQGQNLGGMGTTGSSTGSHLHFELHIGGDGNPVDPEKYLPKL